MGIFQVFYSLLQALEEFKSVSQFPHVAWNVWSQRTNRVLSSSLCGSSAGYGATNRDLAEEVLAKQHLSR